MVGIVCIFVVRLDQLIAMLYWSADQQSQCCMIHEHESMSNRQWGDTFSYLVFLAIQAPTLNGIIQLLK